MALLAGAVFYKSAEPSRWSLPAVGELLPVRAVEAAAPFGLTVLLHDGRAAASPGEDDQAHESYCG